MRPTGSHHHNVEKERQMATVDCKKCPPRVKDLSGKPFGFWTVIDFSEMRGNTPYWNARCACGVVRAVSAYTMTNGRSTRCSNNCPASTSRIDETGNVHGKLTVRKCVGQTKSGDSLWLCDCECGNTTIVARGDLLKKYGGTKSCGCGRRTQGGGHGTPEYTSWKEMKRRCYNPRYREYHLYGGRGIIICDRWRTSFVNFLADMGKKPFPEATIDRFPDLDGPYSPENSRWASRLEQGQNVRKARMLTYNGETMCMRAWARKLGISHCTLSARIKRGWPPERVFS